MKAIEKLGQGQILGMKGTDWSWYFQWGTGRYNNTVLVTEDGIPAQFSYDNYKSKDWIVRSRKILDKVKK
jgi:hypothetical protein